MNHNIKYGLIGMFIGLSCSVAIYFIYTMQFIDNKTDSSLMTNEPLYWVAPMDPNFRKDKPGKSPMGMDLVPVYDRNPEEKTHDTGVIRISPDVINNLGVRTVKASYQTFNTDVNTVGYITYDEDELVSIHTRVTGWIETLHVKALGETVHKGQALYTIYSPELVNAQEELLLALKRKNAPLIRAAENRLTALQLPEITINQLKKNQQVVQNVTVYAPKSGVVEQLNIREGFYAKPSDALMSIADLSTVWVNAELFEQQAHQVKVGSTVLMRLSTAPHQQWRGQVDYIYPTLDANTRTLTARLRFTNKNNVLKPNMFADITIQNHSNKKVLLVPKEAVIRTGFQERVVLALGEGQFKSIEVIVARYNNKYAEIMYGLSEGEEVVSSAQFLLDSESSKSSDFKRMSYRDVVRIVQASGTVKNITQQLTNKKIVNTVNENNMNDRDIVRGSERTLIRIDCDAIEVWNRPAETLAFIVGDDVSLKDIKAGMNVEFTVHVSGGELTIDDIKPITKMLELETDMMELSL